LARALAPEERLRPLPPRWSKVTDQLVRYVASGCRPSLQSELGGWMESRPRFRSFVIANQDKVRKKLSTSDEEVRMDVRAELLVAYLILDDRRFELSFEAYGAGRLGPDLTATFRGNVRINLEVTRVRRSTEPGLTKLAAVIASKLRQLPSDVPNVLVIATRGMSLEEAAVAGAVRQLKSYNQTSGGAREFQAQYVRLGGIFVLDEGVAGVFWQNREARHPLGNQVVASLQAQFFSWPNADVSEAP
jgi:hypothetical protein